MKEYRTVENEVSAEFVERRSRFIGYTRPVRTEVEAAAFINEIKAKNWNAKHNVYAYSIREGQIKRYSDDGEPQGTAGIPALNVIVKSNITDAAIVVTRYFGGILLGTGGLVRAYSRAASFALETAKIVTMRECLLANLTCDYGQYGRLQALISECGGTVDDTVFTDSVNIDFHIAQDNLLKMEPQLADVTCGSVQVETKSKKYFKFFDS